MDADLVMHGSANTPVKVWRDDLFGDMADILPVKGSGWDLEVIEAAGPARGQVGATEAVAHSG